MEQLLVISKGDLLPDLECTLTDDDGNAIPLPAGDTFKLRVYQAVLLEKDATVIDAATGRFNFTWASPETDVPGTFACDVVKITAAGKPTTFPRFYLLIEDPNDK